MADARAAYGQEYSDDRYRQFSKDLMYGPNTVTLKHDPAKNVFEVCNDDLEGN